MEHKSSVRRSDGARPRPFPFLVIDGLLSHGGAAPTAGGTSPCGPRRACGGRGQALDEPLLRIDCFSSVQLAPARLPHFVVPRNRISSAYSIRSYDVPWSLGI